MAFQQQGQAYAGPPLSDPASLWAARAAHWAQQRYTGSPMQPSPRVPVPPLPSFNQQRISGLLQMPSIRPLLDEPPRGVYPSGQVPRALAQPPASHPYSSASSMSESWYENGENGSMRAERIEEYREPVGRHREPVGVHEHGSLYVQDARTDYSQRGGQQVMFMGQPNNVPCLVGHPRALDPMSFERSGIVTHSSNFEGPAVVTHQPSFDRSGIVMHPQSFERPNTVTHPANFERPGMITHSPNFETSSVATHPPNFNRSDIVTHSSNLDRPGVVPHHPLNFGVQSEHRELWSGGDGRTSGGKDPVFESALEHHSMSSPMLATPRPVPLFQSGSVTPSGVDLAKKRLPAWIRDGLAKAGHDLQKKVHEGLAEHQSTVPTNLHDQEDHSVVEMEVVKEGGVDDVAARRISGYEQTVSRSPSPSTDKEEEGDDQKDSDSDSDSEADFVAKVRLLLTEILLEITNEQVKSVAEEIVTAERQKVYLERERTAKGVYGGTGLSVSQLSVSYESDSNSETSTRQRSLSTSAMAGLTNYGSSSEEEEKDDKEAKNETVIKKSPHLGTLYSNDGGTSGDETENLKHYGEEKSKTEARNRSEVHHHHHHHRSTSKRHKSKSPPSKKGRSRSRSRSPVRHKKRHTRSPRRGHRSRSPSRKQSKSSLPRHRHRSKGKSRSKSKSRSRSPRGSHNRKRSRRS